ncbi:MAG: hypothetical protein AAF485_23485 [Chloroflexota bacterium]
MSNETQDLLNDPKPVNSSIRWWMIMAPIAVICLIGACITLGVTIGWQQTGSGETEVIALQTITPQLQ